MTDIREEFEAWADSKYSWLAQEPDHNTLSTWNGGGYENRVVQGMWEAWQASRAALKVELPQSPDLRAHGEFRRGHAVAMTEVTEALQQAGIEVKQP